MATIEHTKEWLNRSFDLYKQLKRLEKRLKKMTFANVSNYEQGFSSRTENSTESKMIEFADLSDKIEKMKARLNKEDSVTEKVIDQVQTPVYWSILKDHYIYRYGWDTIAKSYCYSRRHVLRIHGRALQEVARYVPDED